MDKFEEIRRDLDEGLARLEKFVAEELAPETEKRRAARQNNSTKVSA